MAEEKGQILALVLILMLLTVLIIAPLLDYISTSLKIHRIQDRSTDYLYAADAGIEDAMWQIRFNHLNTTLPTYDEYDYETTWNYSLSNATGTGQVNGQDINVAIQNVWVSQNIPKPIQHSNPDPGSIIQDSRLVVTGTTIQTGINDAGVKVSRYKIRVTYYRRENEILNINTLGIWLPNGFEYYSHGSTYKSNLEGNVSAPYYKVPGAPQQWAGGTVVLWDWDSSAVAFTGLPGVVENVYPLTSEITFYFRPDSDDPSKLNEKPDVIAWVTTSGTNVSAIPYSWNADIKVHKITATAGNTSVESITSVSSLRQLQSAIAGDYYATGNSALSDSDGDYRRETSHDPSIAVVTIDNVPADADVAAAYLYWTAWKNDNSMVTEFSDSCDTFTHWNPVGSQWTISSGRFSGQGVESTSESTITMKSSLDLSLYTSGAVTLSWEQTTAGNLDANDYLYFALFDGQNWSSNIAAFHGPHSPPGSFSYTIPDRFLVSGFMMRVCLAFDEPGEYAYLDDIKITAMEADTSVVFKIDDGSGIRQVYFDENGCPCQGNQGLTAVKSQVLRNFSGATPHGFSYSSFCDVTALVRTYSQTPTPPNKNYPGYATYWVGGIYADTSGTTGGEDEWAYACWSLLIIYTSPNTQGHRIYLYDKFTYSNQDIVNGINVDFDGDGQPGGTISGFIVPQPVTGEVNAGKLTVFVGEGDNNYIGDSVAVNGTKLWDGTITSQNSKSNPNNVFNSTSVGLGAYDGIDIDTLGLDPPNYQYITWNSNILKPGDTSARIDLVTYKDVWNLVYMILSFRSSVTGGDTLSYTVHKN